MCVHFQLIFGGMEDLPIFNGLMKSVTLEYLVSLLQLAMFQLAQTISKNLEPNLEPLFCLVKPPFCGSKPPE